MNDIVFWLYLFTFVFLTIHEIDSAYWKEWDLFRLPFGQSGFLVLHIPLLFVGVAGLFLIYEHLISGYIIAAVFGLAGIAAFIIHQTLIRKGHEEFTTTISQAILWLVLIFSVLLVIFELLQVLHAFLPAKINRSL
ncbi:MAG: hypothetical protein JW874_07290 [Spirochaetales bacterium]|nr:hypothetical protein [Spirochaetales bacterium]